MFLLTHDLQKDGQIASMADHSCITLVDGDTCNSIPLVGARFVACLRLLLAALVVARLPWRSAARMRNRLMAGLCSL